VPIVAETRGCLNARGTLASHFRFRDGGQDRQRHLADEGGGVLLAVSHGEGTSWVVVVVLVVVLVNMIASASNRVGPLRATENNTVSMHDRIRFTSCSGFS